MKTLHANKYHENDFSRDIELNRMFLRIIGVWPTITRRSRLTSRFAITISVVLFMFFFLPQSCYVFLVEKDSSMRLREFGPLSFTAMAFIRYVIVLRRQKDLKSCIDLIANDWRRADNAISRTVMLRYTGASRLFTKLYASVMYGGVGFYTWILPFVNGRDKAEKPLPYPVEFFVFDAQTSPIYEIVFVGYSISMLGVVCTATCGICTTTVKLVMHACSQFEIVIAFVKSIDDCNAEDENFTDATTRNILIERRLAEIVHRHLYALVFVSRIDEVLNEICLIDVAGGTINICIVGYYLLTDWNNSEAVGLVTYFLLWLTMVSNVFVFCYIGEHLSEQVMKASMAYLNALRTVIFISWTEKILRNICLVELLGSTLNLCLLGFDLLMEWEHSGPVAMLTYAILITSFVFNILLFCYIGDILIDECKKVGEKTYMIDWYKLPSKTALGLILTIATADNPTTITAGNMTKLSITTFCTVIKTSIGYLNILRTLTA